MKPLILEHLIPRSRGGDDSTANTAIACTACNIRKRDMTPLEWFLVASGFWFYMRNPGDRGRLRMHSEWIWRASGRIYQFEPYEPGRKRKRA